MTFPSHTSAPEVSSLDADSVTSPPVTRLSIKTTVEVRDVARVCGNERDEQENFDRGH